MEQVTQTSEAKALAWWKQYKFNGSGRDAATDAYLAATQAKDEEIARLVEELRLWRMLVDEGGVPRYTITPGAALNTIVTSTDAMLRRYPNA